MSRQALARRSISLVFFHSPQAIIIIAEANDVSGQAVLEFLVPGSFPRRAESTMSIETAKDEPRTLDPALRSAISAR